MFGHKLKMCEACSKVQVKNSSLDPVTSYARLCEFCWDEYSYYPRPDPRYNTFRHVDDFIRQAKIRKSINVWDNT